MGYCCFWVVALVSLFLKSFARLFFRKAAYPLLLASYILIEFFESFVD